MAVPVTVPWPHSRERLINRYYDPVTGQFVSVDPMVGSTQTAYAYARDNAVSGVDYLGWLIAAG